MPQVLAVADFKVEFVDYVKGAVISFADQGLIDHLKARGVIVVRPADVAAAIAGGAQQVFHVRGAPPASPSGVGRLGAFSTTLVFLGDLYMAEKVISGPLAFTADMTGAVPGSSVTLRLIADGANPPSFAGMKEVLGSQGWLNTAGILNNVVVFYDGSDVYYTVSRAIGVAPVPSPVITSSFVPVGAPTTISLVYSVALDATQVPPASAFSIVNSGGTQNVTGVAISGNTVTLTTSRTAQASDVITLNYVRPVSDAGKLKAQGGAFAAALNARSVTAPGVEQVVRFTNLAGITEGGNASGYSYTGTTAAYAGSGGLATVSMPANTAASVRAHLAANSTQFIMGLQPNATAANYTAYAVGIYANGVGTPYQQIVNGAPSAMPVAVNQAAGDIVELSSDAAGNQVARVSQDGGATWTTLRTFPAVNTARKYVNICFGSNGSSITKVMGTGVA